MSDLRDDNFAELERRARDAFQASVDELDAATLSRLNRSRQQALTTATARQRSGWRWSFWAPVGALAAGVLAAVLLLQSPSPTALPPQIAATASSSSAQQDPLELLTAGDDLTLATEADLEFYAWVEIEGTADDDGVG